MSYQSIENSLDDSLPVRFYLFTLGAISYAFNNSAIKLTRSLGSTAYDWIPTPIYDDGVNQTGEAASDALTITCSDELWPSRIYKLFPPASPVQVMVYEGHADDPNLRMVYRGEITSHDIPQPGTASLICETISATMAREGLRLRWQRSCPYALYDEVTCLVPKAAYAQTTAVSAITNNVLTMPGLAANGNGYFDGGFIEWTLEGRGIERRMVESWTSPNLTLFGTADGLDVGTVITAYPGCARTTDACSSFNNLANYGGAPALQGTSPFDGTPVFN